MEHKALHLGLPARCCPIVKDDRTGEILGEPAGAPILEPDPQQLASLKHYRSLMPLAQDARKPMFLLTAADGAIGGHSQAVVDCYRDFRALALRVAAGCGLAVP